MWQAGWILHWYTDGCLYWSTILSYILQGSKSLCPQALMQLKHIVVELSFKKKITLLGFFHFKLFICPPVVKRLKCFRGFTPEPPTRAPISPAP